MRTSRPKVLMLGWEFPPVINGGLGVACHDLSSAMAEKAEITMIIPKSSPGYKLAHMNLIGVNTVDPDSLENLPSSYHMPLPFPVHMLPADLNPYYSEPVERQGLVHGSLSRRSIEAFGIENLYDGNVAQKVMHFADISAALASKMEFDVIHAHDWMTMVAGMKIRQMSGKPLVVHVHSLEVDRCGPESKGWVYHLEKAGMQCADVLMPVSNFTASNIVKHYGIDPSRITVVHNGGTKVEPFKTKAAYPEKTVLFVGRITMQKGPEKFIDIASRVLDKEKKVRFVMAGVGDNFRSVIEKSSWHNLGNRVHMTGFLNSEKLRQLLSFSDVYCMPSVSEPFGLSAIEAAQFKIPCVISKQSGVSEVLTGALKFDFWDVDRAAGYILNLLHDETLRAKVVQDASVNLKNITWTAAADKVIKAYKKL